MKKLTNITIYDIAKELKISPGTVSRVLNHSDLISDSTSKKILDTAKSLGYIKRQIKKQAQRSILNIKIILDEVNGGASPTFYDFTKLIHSFSEACNPVRINFGLDLSHDKLNLFDHKKSGNLDGVIFPFNEPSEELQKQMRIKKTPFVTINRNLKNCDHIIIDTQKGSEALYQKLLNTRKDLKPLYLYSDSTIPTLRCRKEFFTSFFTDKGLLINENHFIYLKNPKSFDSTTLENIQQRNGNALICMNDLFASTALIKCLQEQVKIPKDLAITGFDNSTIQNLLPFRVDTIDLPIEKIGNSLCNWVQSKIILKHTELFHETIVADFIPGDTIP